MVGCRTPHPHLTEVKRVYQPIRFHRLQDRRGGGEGGGSGGEGGLFAVENRFDFLELVDAGLVLSWELLANGEPVAHGSLSLADARGVAGPGKWAEFAVPELTEAAFRQYTDGDGNQSELVVTLAATQRAATALTPAGHEVGWEQFVLRPRQPATDPRPGLRAECDGGRGAAEIQVSADLVVTGPGFEMAFSKATGLLEAWTVRGAAMLVDDAPQPNFWRGLTDNDLGVKDQSWLLWKEASTAAGRKLLAIPTAKQISPQEVAVSASFALPAAKGAEYFVRYTILADGSLTVAGRFVPGPDPLPPMLRFGFQLRVPGRLRQMSWYGKGPGESYADRQGLKVGRWQGAVAEQFHRYPRPQETGNKTAVRWMRLTDPDLPPPTAVGASAGAGADIGIGGGAGPAFVVGLEVLASDEGPASLLECSAWPFAAAELDPATGQMAASGLVPLTSRHGTDIALSDELVTLNIDAGQMGVGGQNSWGSLPSARYMLPASAERQHCFRLRPLLEGGGGGVEDHGSGGGGGSDGAELGRL